MGWAEQELETIDLGDPRLNQRAVLLAERLGQRGGGCGLKRHYALADALALRAAYIDVKAVALAHARLTSTPQA